MKSLPIFLTAMTLACVGSSSVLAASPQFVQEKTVQSDGVKGKETKSAVPCPLSAEQKKAIQLIQAKNQIKLAPMALKLAATVKQVYDNLLADNMDEQLADRLRQQMKDTVGELVVIRGEAMREAVKVLTADQKRYLKRELTKPGTPGEMIEALMKVFQVPES
ncbi:hypothetical protein BH10PLA2_BH10PLA2_22730 [soil metagenome]